MFTVKYNEFVDNAFYSDFKVSYMPGLKVMNMSSAKVILNVDSKTAFVFCE